MTLYKKIQSLCKREGFEISNLGEKIPGIKITRGSISRWKSGATPRANNIKAIAEYFGVPIEYLVNDSEDSQIFFNSVKGNANIIGNSNVIGKSFTEQERILLDIFDKLDVIKKAQLLTYAVALKDKEEQI